ncbi:hypothetical protein N665_0573s0026 [Sinapis alba]|nr:hypothetical protein N665_0573s0026 [Sinapis alba]
MITWGQVQCCIPPVFACPYTYTLWLQVIGSLLQPAPSPDRNERIMAGPVGLLPSILLRLAFQVSIYYIWKERNERRHAQSAKPVDQLKNFIEKTIRQRILSTKYYEKAKLQRLIK